MISSVKISGVLAAFALAVLLPGVATAKSLGSLGSLSQERFLKLSKNLSAATHYKGLAPAETLGILGLDIGVEVSSTEISSQLFDDASDGNFKLDNLIIPRLQVIKGLPFGLDIGASISAVPDTDISIIAGELRYALISGGALTPAVAVRGSYSQLQGITDYDLKSGALELTVSKGFLLLTPYAGAGIVRGSADPTNLGSLSAVTFNQKKFYVGLTINFGLAVTLEAEKTGDYQTYSVKAGIRF